MKLVKSKPRFKCDFCRRVSGKVAMENHEKICYKNPNRFCENCKNKGETYEYYDEGLYQTSPCPYCKTADEIKELEAQKERERIELENSPQIPIGEIPF